jgi:hypothetical protein
MNDGDSAAATPFIASSAYRASSAPSQTPGYRRINSYEGANSRRNRTMAVRKRGGWVLAASYVFDWIILIVVAVVGFILGNITPNKRPFNLEDRDISYATFATFLPGVNCSPYLTNITDSPTQSRKQSRPGS